MSAQTFYEEFSHQISSSYFESRFSDVFPQNTDFFLLHIQSNNSKNMHAMSIFAGEKRTRPTGESIFGSRVSSFVIAALILFTYVSTKLPTH